MIEFKANIYYEPARLEDDIEGVKEITADVEERYYEFKEYLKIRNPKNYAILTPYKNQVTLIACDDYKKGGREERKRRKGGLNAVNQQFIAE